MACKGLTAVVCWAKAVAAMKTRAAENQEEHDPHHISPRLRMLAYVAADRVLSCHKLKESAMGEDRMDIKKETTVLDIRGIHKHTAIIAVVRR